MVWNYYTICSIVHMHSYTLYAHITHLLQLKWYFLSSLICAFSYHCLLLEKDQ